MQLHITIFANDLTARSYLAMPITRNVPTLIFRLLVTSLVLLNYCYGVVYAGVDPFLLCSEVSRAYI